MGPFIPEVVLDHPELVKNMHEEFVHAGSDAKSLKYIIERQPNLQNLNEQF
jgi:betaine-homocysteine S-methyltransferase